MIMNFIALIVHLHMISFGPLKAFEPLTKLNFSHLFTFDFSDVSPQIP